MIEVEGEGCSCKRVCNCERSEHFLTGMSTPCRNTVASDWPKKLDRDWSDQKRCHVKTPKSQPPTSISI
jgi:hypothetical protein